MASLGTRLMSARRDRLFRGFASRVRRRTRRRGLPGRVVVFGAKGFPHVTAAGGVERFVEQLAKRLERAGVDCLVYERAPRPAWHREGRTVVRRLPFIDRKNHAHWSHAVLAVLDYLAHRRPADVLHVHSVQNGWVCALLRPLGHRVVFHLHGQEWRVAKWGPVMSLFMRVSMLPALLFSNVVVTVCEESRRRLVARFPSRASRVVHIPNGLPRAPTPAAAATAVVLSEYGVAPGRFLLYAGRLVPQKRVELILQALAVSGSNDALVVAGAPSNSASYAALLREEARRCGVADRVHFVGQLDWDRLLCLYATCRALVHPTDSEGCSNTLLEAIASGACVICSDLPENRAVVGDAGIYVSPGDLAGLATALQTLARAERVAERRQAAVARRERLRSWDDVAGEFLRLYGSPARDQHAANPALLGARTRLP